EGHGRTPGRVLDQRGFRHVRVPCRRAQRDDAGLRRRGAVDLCGLEAGRGAHGARVPPGVRAADRLAAAVQRLRPGPDRRRRDPRLHRGGARRPGPDDPRRRLADPRLVLRRRHGRGPAAHARAPERDRRELQHRQRALGGDDLRPRPPDQAALRLPGRAGLPADPLPRRRAADPERRQGADAARLRGRGRAGRGPRADDRVVPAEGADIRLARPDVGEEELAEVAAVLETGQLTMGPKVAELETELARVCEVAHAVAVSSGTAALHLAVLALGIGPGDEVIVPAYTFPATANVVALAGAKPVLADVDPETFNLDPAQVEVTPRTKAI